MPLERVWEVHVDGTSPSVTTRDGGVEPGIGVVHELVAALGRGLSVTSLPLTLRLLRFSRGRAAVDQVFERCWTTPSDELDADALGALFGDVPHLTEVLAYELALIGLARERTGSTVEFTCVPGPLLDALRAGRLPPHLEARALHPSNRSWSGQPQPAQLKAAAVAAAGPPSRTTSPTAVPSAAAGSLVAS
jgi:hypothetical protein